MLMQELPEIQIWLSFDSNGSHGAFPVTHDPKTDAFRIKIVHDEELLPPPITNSLKQKIATVHDRIKNNNLTTYILDIEHTDENVDISAHIMPFDATYFFNRTQEGSLFTDELVKHKALSLSTHAIVITLDGYVVYGTKRNQNNQISGWGGFPRENVDFQSTTEYIDLKQLIFNRVCGELNIQEQHVSGVFALGTTYVSRPALRGVDINYMIQLNQPLHVVEARFKKNDQFGRYIHACKLSPQALIDFFVSLHKHDIKMSPYALGTAVSAIRSCFGRVEAERLMSTVREKLGLSIGFGNTTGYFD